MEENQESGKKIKRGFAVMDREKQREIARLGGKSAHQKGVAHRWTSKEASAAGKKGGLSKRKANGSRSGKP